MAGQARAAQALADARRAVVDGMSVVERAQEDFRFEERHGPGPREQAWQLGEIGRAPPPDPEPFSAASYYLDLVDLHFVKAIGLMLALAKLTKKAGLKAAAYRTGGIYLQRLRHRHERTEWIEIVERECALSARRAYELVAIAAKAKPLAELRSAGAARAKKHRKLKASRRDAQRKAA